MTAITRRQFATMPAAALMAVATTRRIFAQSPSASITRAIPVSGEPLPAVGLGTAEIFDTDDAATRQSASAVIQALL
ncbi:MAG TPA: aldo/keto reductase, partial [Xanthobacteraceae bacterium]